MRKACPLRAGLYHLPFTPVPTAQSSENTVTLHQKPFSFKFSKQPEPLVGELTGDDTAIACGIAAHSSSPVLALCRELIAAGLPPDQSLTVAALHVRSLREAATLEVAGHGEAFIRRAARRASPPMRKTGWVRS